MGGGPVMSGEYIELVPYERLVFSFGWEPHENAPHIAPRESRVEVTLIDDAGDTILTLRHIGIPDASAAEQHASGWTNFLALLAEAAGSSKQPPA
jgi:uncharacterized protein YndB with AHSA1/START domain